MKKLMFSGMIILVLCFSANAQNAASYKTTLAKLMTISGATKTSALVIDQMFSIFRKQQSNVPEAFWTEARAEMNIMASDDFINMLVPVYQKHLTEAELKAVIAFYETPAGKKYAGEIPLITQESMVVGQEWGKAIGEKIISKLREKKYMN